MGPVDSRCSLTQREEGGGRALGASPETLSTPSCASQPAVCGLALNVHKGSREAPVGTESGRIVEGGAPTLSLSADASGWPMPGK